MGRPKGSLNKAIDGREAHFGRAGITPVDYMLNKLRDPRAPEKVRMWAAATAAPYVHPKLAMIDMRAWLEMNAAGADTRQALDPMTLTYDERAAIRAAVLRIAVQSDDEPTTIDGAFEVKDGPA